MPDTIDRLKAALADRYRIERELGAGGMATVYLAEDLKHRRQVAIKVLRPELAASLGVERFVREIEIAANLTHPHILPLFDSGEAGGFLYYVMPYIEGESLRERIDRDGKLSIPQAIRLTDQVASALSHAHELGLVHRDIKPENILLAGDQAIVADFGIARAVEVAGGELLPTACSGVPRTNNPLTVSEARSRRGSRADVLRMCLTTAAFSLALRESLRAG
jgi:serine/threonine-protein kinase